VNEKLHNYARLTQAIAKARKANRGLAEAIESVMDWDALAQRRTPGEAGEQFQLRSFPRSILTVSSVHAEIPSHLPF
jgi:hypothetical protein